ncbi:MAG: methyltransferase domain-containing protein [Ignavibacteriae bacterium]|nr:methyltransferase domain-containing protein [Ignavibacteriota bacterium]MCB9214419.1 methyltransferase domain-containing protein [Ignavibacteria bacterium]
MQREPQSEEEAYILGTEPEELRRLIFQHRVWVDETSDLWKMAGISRGETLLDLGCGPGFTTIDMASLVGSGGKVIAADKSLNFIEHLRRQRELHALENIELHCADFDHLSLPEKSLDGVFARWVLCWLKNPEEIVKQVAAALRPGAFFAVLDYFNWGVISLVPEGSALHRLKAASLEVWREEGCDINIGQRIPQMFQRSGLQVESIEPIARIARPGSMTWEWIGSFLKIWGPKLVGHGLLSEEEEEELQRAWQRHEADPAAFCVAPIMVSIVGRKV